MVKLYKKHLNGILADETGLGKTVQTVAYMAHLAGQEGMFLPPPHPPQPYPQWGSVRVQKTADYARRHPTQNTIFFQPLSDSKNCVKTQNGRRNVSLMSHHSPVFPAFPSASDRLLISLKRQEIYRLTSTPPTPWQKRKLCLQRGGVGLSHRFASRSSVTISPFSFQSHSSLGLDYLFGPNIRRP